MTVIMDKVESAHLPYSDYKHLAVDNLSFVTGLRVGSTSDLTDAPTAKASLRAQGSKSKTSGTNEEADHEGAVSPDEEMGTARQQGCPNRSCAARTDTLEGLMERRINVQTARQRTQSKLSFTRDKASEVEKRLEDAQAELARMTRAVEEADERAEFLRGKMRGQGSANKMLAAALDMIKTEAMGLRRAVTADTLPPRTTGPVERPAWEDGRILHAPTTPLGNIPRTGQQLFGNGNKAWIHNGHLGQAAHMHMRGQQGWRSKSNGSKDATIYGDLVRKQIDPYGGNISKPVVGFNADTSGWEEEGFSSATAAAVAATDGDVDDRSDAEDTWSCCGKTTVAAGIGCGPIEPKATPQDLLLDTIDPRSRLGRPLDFRDFLPRIAWPGSAMDPMPLFASSINDGFLRPHTAPERLGRGGARTVGLGGLTTENLNKTSSRLRASGDGDGGKFRWSRPKPARDHASGTRFRSHDRGALAKKGEGAAAFYSCGIRRSIPLMAAGNKRGVAANFNSRSMLGEDGGRDRAVDFRPRTQLLGMNATRPPRVVRQAPQDRPLTAPCGSVGRRVRVRSGRGPATQALRKRMNTNLSPTKHV